MTNEFKYALRMKKVSAPESRKRTLNHEPARLNGVLGLVFRCSVFALLFALSACGERKEDYLTEFRELVGQAQFHPEAKTDSDWGKIVEKRAEFLRKKFVEVHAELTEEELARIDSLDEVLRGTVLRYTKKQKIYEELTKQ